MNFCPAGDWSPIKSRQRDSFWLITFWLAWLILVLLIQEGNVLICSGRCHQEEFLCLSLSRDLVFQRPIGIRLGIADMSAPGENLGSSAKSIYAKFYNITEFILSWTAVIAIAVICWNCCFTLHVGDLEALIDEWPSLSGVWGRKRKHRSLPFTEEEKAWSGKCRLFLHSCLFIWGKIPSSKPSQMPALRGKELPHRCALDIHLARAPMSSSLSSALLSVHSPYNSQRDLCKHRVAQAVSSLCSQPPFTLLWNLSYCPISPLWPYLVPRSTWLIIFQR